MSGPEFSTSMRADQIRVGMVVVLERSRFRVEATEETAIGMIRLTHGNGTASDCYWPFEPVRVA